MPNKPGTKGPQPEEALRASERLQKQNPSLVEGYNIFVKSFARFLETERRVLGDKRESGKDERTLVNL